MNRSAGFEMRGYPRLVDAIIFLLLSPLACSASSSDDPPGSSGGFGGSGGGGLAAGAGNDDSPGDSSADGGAAGSSDGLAGAAGSAGRGDTEGALGEAGGPSAPHLDAPDNAEQLVPFLEAGAYSNWRAEPAFHPSAGPHGASVRTFYGPIAAASLAAREGTFPAGAATIKEAAGDDGVITGWSVWVKVQADSDRGKGFYWYEVSNGQVFADARGFGGCVGCHAAGVDFLRSPGVFE